MTGYSGTPLPKKLGIKPGHRVMVLNAPAGFALEDVPVVTRASGMADVILSFHTQRSDLAKRIPVLRDTDRFSKTHGIPTFTHHQFIDHSDAAARHAPEVVVNDPTGLIGSVPGESPQEWSGE